MTHGRLRTRLLAFAVTCVLLLAASELTSFILFHAVTGKRFSYQRIAREQAEVAALAGSTVIARPEPSVQAPPPPDRAVPGRPETTPSELVPHPFMGFVYDPESALLQRQQGRGAMELTELGFFRFPEPPGGSEALSMAVFGGSVATYLSVDGREALARALAADPRLAERSLRVHCFALGGFKQPQTAAALTYLLALGHRFDVVVELDGFNELALSFMDHKGKGLFPAYPHDWDRLVSVVPDVQDQRRIGTVAYLEDWRGRLARRFSRPPFSWSVTTALVWKSLNRGLGAELARAREGLATARPQHSSYRDRGPLRHYATDNLLLADIARVWGLSSLQMHRLCTSAGTRYYHFLQPNQYVPGSKPMSNSERSVAYDANASYRQAIEQGYPLLQGEGARLAAMGVAFHDLSRLFAGMAEPLYVDNCCHVNAKGSAIMGQAIGRTIATGWKR